MLKGEEAERLGAVATDDSQGRMSPREMASALGISKTQVKRDIQTILDDLTVSNREAAERLVTTSVDAASARGWSGCTPLSELRAFLKSGQAR